MVVALMMVSDDSDNIDNIENIIYIGASMCKKIEILDCL